MALALALALAERLICSGPTLNRCLRQLPHRQPLEDLHARAREYFGMFIGSSQHNPKMSTLSGSLVLTSSLLTLHSLLPICLVPIFSRRLLCHFNLAFMSQHSVRLYVAF